MLRIGDIIALRHMKPYEGWLAAEGILSEDLILMKDGTNCFENCLWEITVQNQYNAVKEYEDQLEVLSRNKKEEEEGEEQEEREKDLNNHEKKRKKKKKFEVKNKSNEIEEEKNTDEDFYEQFLFASMNENKLNERLMTMKTGKSVAYGDVIQLRHVKTRGFLTISSSQLAKHEKENMRIEIDATGNSLSWLEFMPRFKYDKEGQQILHENECHIRVHERPSEFVHAARKISKYSSDGNREINCSLENSAWTISIFQQCWESKSKNVLCGQLVSLQETETSSYLAINPQHHPDQGNSRPINLYSQQISLTVSDCNVGTNLLWMIEAENPFAGGQITHRTGKYALRDLNSGLYMKLESDGLCAVKDRANCSYFEFNGGQSIENGSAVQENGMVQMLNRNHWICAKKSANSYRSQGMGTEDRSIALSFLISSKIQRSLGVDVFVGVEALNYFNRFKTMVRSKQIHSLSIGQIENEFRGLFSCMDTLSQFLNQPKMQIAEENDLVAVLEPTGAASLVIRQTMLREQGILNALLDIIEMTAIGLLDDLNNHTRLKKLASQTSIAMDDSTEYSQDQGSDEMVELHKYELKHSKLRASFGGSNNQDHLKRLSLALKKHRDAKNSKRATLADVVMEAMKSQKRGSLVDQSPANPPPVGKSKSRTMSQSLLSKPLPQATSTEEEKEDTAQVSLPKELARCCFNVLFLAIYRNHESQIHIADYFSLLLNQVRDQDVSVACVQEMLRDNLEMLQTKVGENEIKIFLDLLIQTEMNVTIMKLLRSTCTCPHGVDNTQRMVVNALFQREKISRVNAVSHSTASKWRRKTSMRLLRTGNEQETNPFGFVPISPSTSSLNLLKKTRSVLISIKEDNSVLRTESWSEKPVYFPSIGNNEMVLGYCLVQSGLPSLTLSWQSYPDSGGDDFSMLTLFGCQNEIPFRYLCNYSEATGRNGQSSMYIAPQENEVTPPLEVVRRGTASGKKRLYSVLGKNNRKGKMNTPTVKEKSVYERKKQIAAYFIAQLYLAADLCLDRNYVSITLLEKVYSYNMLLTILKTKATTNQFKAPVCRMIRSLYIDRDPQTEVKFPRLIKTSADLRGNPMGGFDDSTGRSPYAFGLLQQIISDYLHHQLDISRCDELSAEMMSLLLELMRFGYYNTTEQLQDIIDPLVNALEQHRFIVNQRQNISPEMEEDVENDDLNPQTFDSIVAAAVAANRSRKSISHSILAAIQHIGSQESFKMGIKVKPDSSSDDSSEDEKEVEMIPKKKPENTNVTEGEEITESFPARILRTLESLRFICFILLLVLVTTILSGIELFGSNRPIPGQGAFDLFVSIVFIAELMTRMYCYTLVHGEIKQFFLNSFNWIDISVVALDVVLLSIDTPSLESAASFTKTLRTIRILRLIRVVRAARLLKKIAERTKQGTQWSMPTRYSIVTESEARTIVGMMKILVIILDRIQDRKLNSSFKAYIEWLELERNGHPANAPEIYRRTLEEGNNQGVSIPPEFDNALMDIVMYSDNNLVKEALHLLMIHKSQDRLLSQTMHKLQIISDPKVEEKYRELTYCLNGMRKRAESFEIWGQFLTESDSNEAEELLNLVQTITRILRTYKPVHMIDFRPPCVADREIQQLLANLGGLEDVMVLQRALMDASLEKMDPRIAKILRACNEMVKTFIMYNETNQNLAFSYFGWFVNHVEDDVGSSQVVRAMLHQNKYLIKQCPRKYITEFIQKIVKNGRNPDYLDLFVGLVDLEDNGDSGVASVRSEIAKHITSMERSTRILFWCCPMQSEEYEERLKAMAPFVGYDVPPSDEELPSDLRYHINLLHLLAGCKLGPKLQGVYPIDDIIYAMLDPGTILNVQYALGSLLVNALDVKIEGIESCESLWTFFESICEFLERAESELPLWLRVTSIHHRYYSQNTRWLQICLRVTIKFFSNFEFSNFFNASSYDSDVSFDLTERSEEDVNEIITRLSDAISGLYEKNRDFLESETALLFSDAITFVSQLSSEYTGENVRETFPKRDKRRSNIVGGRSLSDEVQQVFYRRKFEDFLSLITSNDHLHEMSVKCFLNIPFIDAFTDSDIRFEPFILKISNHIRSQIEKGSLLSSLKPQIITPTLWILQTLQSVLRELDTEVQQTQQSSKFANDAMKYRSAMNTCGITYLCLDLIAVGIDSNITTEAMKLLASLLTSIDVACISAIQSNVHLYLVETDSTLFFEQLKGSLEAQMLWSQRFGVGLGFDETSYSLPDSLIVVNLLSAMCQNNFMENKSILLNQEGNSRFVNILDVLADFIDVLSRLESPACTKVSIYVIDAILILMQGPCWTSQEHFILHTDILVALNRIMRLSHSLDPSSIWFQDRERLKESIIDLLRASIECLPAENVVIERVQASIEVNVLNTLILPIQTDEYGLVKDLTELTSLQAKYLVFLKTLNDRSTEIPGNALNRIESEIGSIEVVWNQHVFTHYFHVPPISHELSESSKFKIIEDMNCGSQELKLFGFLQHAKDLYREATHQHQLKISGINNIWKLFGFLAQGMLANAILMNILLVVYYRERFEHSVEIHTDDHTDDHHTDDHSNSTHGVESTFFSVHNMIIQSGTGAESTVGADYGDIPVSVPSKIHSVLFGLNIIHIIAAIITLVVIIVMRVPVMYSTQLEFGHTKLVACLRSLADPLPLWYLCYLIVSILSIQRNFLFLSILLLDFIVLDSTSRDVLYAVVIPIRQLLSTFIIMVIVLYISAAVIFVYFRTDYLHFPSDNQGMYESMLLAFTFGIRAPEGLGEAMYETIGVRMILDLAIYFIVVVILRNIFFGIIISTFAELRTKKEERDEHISDRCFICGINRHEYNKNIRLFNRQLSQRNDDLNGNKNGAIMIPNSHDAKDTHDFNTHRSVVHNMWNYLYFILRMLHQNSSEDTSLEMYIRHCIAEGDISWIPIGLAGLEERSGESSAKVDQENIEPKEGVTIVEDRNDRDKEENTNLLELKLNLILDKFIDKKSHVSVPPTTTIQGNNQPTTPARRKGGISRQSSFEDAQVPNSEQNIQQMANNKTKSMKSLILNLKQSLNHANQRLTEVSVVRTHSHQNPKNPTIESLKPSMKKDDISEIAHTPVRKFTVTGPSLSLVHDSDNDSVNSLGSDLRHFNSLVHPLNNRYVNIDTSPDSSNSRKQSLEASKKNS